MSSASVHAIVVNWNGGEDTARCLARLVEQGVAAAHLHLVDNGSTDGSVALARRAVPGLELLELGRNTGFGAAANAGAARALEAGADLLLFVNNDALLERGCLDALLDEAARAPLAGFFGPRVVLPGSPSLLWAAGGVLGFGPNLSRLRGQGLPDAPGWHGTIDVDYVPGCVLLARAEAWRATGGFDDAYFAYTEDVDLGVRAGALGIGSRVVGRALAVHAASSATGGGYNPRRKFLMARGAVRFLRTHGGAARWLAWLVCDVLALPLALLAAWPRGEAGAVFAKALGTLDGLLGRSFDPERLEPGRGPAW